MCEMVTIIAEALSQQQGTLNVIASLQERDVHGIEGIYRLYNGLQGKDGAFDTSQVNQEECGEYVLKVGQLESMSRAEALDALEGYLIAATFRDCSLIITFANWNAETSSQKRGLFALPNAGIITGVSEQDVFYRMQLIDTDLKHVSKIPVHFQKSEQIASLFLGSEGDERRQGV